MAREFSEKEMELIRQLQDDIPLTPSPFADIAARVGMTEDEVLAKMKEWISEGTIRRFGAMVRHQRLGYKANAMSAWDVPDGRVEEVGAVFAAAPEVSHCYQRPRAEAWDYNVFAMIHAATEEECAEVAAKLASKAGIEDYGLLFSSREFKKISMRYFVE